VHLESLRIREDGPQHARGGLRLQRAVEHGRQVRRDQVQPAVLRIRVGDAGRRVRGPHRGSAGADAQELVLELRIARGLREHLPAFPIGLGQGRDHVAGVAKNRLSPGVAVLDIKDRIVA